MSGESVTNSLGGNCVQQKGLLLSVNPISMQSACAVTGYLKWKYTAHCIRRRRTGKMGRKGTATAAAIATTTCC